MTKLMPLGDRLTEIRQAFESGETPDHVVETLNSHVDWLIENRVEERALKLGQHVSLDHSIQMMEGPATLGELKGKDFLVLTWFRGNW